MIVKSSDADRYAARPPDGIAAFLVFGPDSGLVRERAETMMKTVVADLNDAFRVADLDGDALASDPARLADEAAAIPMLGGRRVVRVRGAGNALAKVFESFLDDPAGGAMIVVEGGDLAKGTGLRKLFEEAGNAAAIACYPDSARDLHEVVRSGLKSEGFAIAPDALEDAVSRLGSDRGVTRRELEKLALYCHGRKSVTIEDVRAVLGDEAEARAEEAIDAAGTGDVGRLDPALERLWVAGISPVAVLRQAMSHFQRVLLVAVESRRGESAESAMRRLRPPVHFARAASFRRQAERWSEAALGEILGQLLDTEALCKTTAVPGEAACGRALMNIAARARMLRC
jgi:DNA polymerase-3 subunit delta